MKKILIAGGTGFIGKHLIRKSLKKGWKTFCLSSKKVGKKDKVKKVKYFFIDIRNKKKLTKLKKYKFDYVVNLSGEVNHKIKVKVIETHFLGVKNLLRNLNLNYLKSFIQIGSSAEYGKYNKLQKEILKCHPNSYYGKAKLSATNYLINNNKYKNFSKCVLRFYQVYGPNQKDNRIIPYVIKNCLLDKKFNCTPGTQIRDFTYITDIISAIFKCFSHTKKVNNQIINIGYGKGYKLQSVIKRILNYIGKGKPYFGAIKMRKDETKKVIPNISKAKKILKWKPKITLNEGLKLTINSFK